MNTAVEANFDGLIGPSHNYGGLSHGNVASKNNALKLSTPKQAALEGLQKMKFLHDLGMIQGVLLPQQRPHLPTLRNLGFSGSDSQIIEKVSSQAPALLAQCYSASSMWSANAATVSPSADTDDGKVHFTPANLNSMFHRSIEHPQTGRLLRSIFNSEKHFNHHAALPAASHFGDEGAANHNRFANAYGDAGVQLFVYGRSAFATGGINSKKYPSRQTLEASQAIARQHSVSTQRVVYAQQNPAIIDAGAFHNDVVSVSNLNAFFMHEQAFLDTDLLKQELQNAFGSSPIDFIEVPTARVSLDDAVKSYLFNSQLIQEPSKQGMSLILPIESQDNQAVHSYLQEMVQTQSQIKYLHFVDVRQSMQNGGGPACLRLRVVLKEDELAAVNNKFIFSDALHGTLKSWVEKHYRDTLSAQDLRDPQLADEVFCALDELTQIFDLQAFYEFQR